MKTILLNLALLSVYSCAQTGKPHSKTGSEISQDTTNILLQRQQKRTMTTDQLKAEAKKRNIPYRKETGGKIYELQGFDKNGNPLYYSTGDVQK